MKYIWYHVIYGNRLTRYRSEKKKKVHGPINRSGPKVELLTVIDF